MEKVITGTADIPLDREDAVEASSPAYQAYQILRVGFTVAPIVAGADKFLNVLTDWDKYLPPFINQITGGRGQELMFMAGAVEIIAGLGVWFPLCASQRRPRTVFGHSAG